MNEHVCYETVKREELRPGDKFFRPSTGNRINTFLDKIYLEQGGSEAHVNAFVEASAGCEPTLAFVGCHEPLTRIRPADLSEEQSCQSKAATEVAEFMMGL